MGSNEILRSIANLSMKSVEIRISTVRLLSGIRDVRDASISLSHASEELSASIAKLRTTAHLLSRIHDVKDASISLSHASEELSASIAKLQDSAERSSDAAQESKYLINNDMTELGNLKQDIIQNGNIFNIDFNSNSRFAGRRIKS